jgi:prepilin-type processing-associated H-X9-DG protein
VSDYLPGGDYTRCAIITGETACPDGARQSYPSWPLPVYGHNACMNPPGPGGADEAIETLAAGWGVTRLSQLDQVRKQSTVFMLNENNNYYAYTYGDTSFGLALDNHSVWPSESILRHKGMGLNTSYMDGHAAFVKAPFAKGVNIFYDDND